jgi:hypothetical protein
MLILLKEAMYGSLLDLATKTTQTVILINHELHLRIRLAFQHPRRDYFICFLRMKSFIYHRLSPFLISERAMSVLFAFLMHILEMTFPMNHGSGVTRTHETLGV